MRTLNLGILAHVDAGKTTLTERLLFAAGVIDRVGSVDKGTTQTDTLALERERGITIKSAVASFAIGDLAVNLIDTPGHPDFIAEVERGLSVLDGAVLVVSAVEGVQPQTPLLMRALQRLRVPTLIFVNKIDRIGASDERVVAAMARRLTPAIVPMGKATGLGTRDAGFNPAGADDASFRRAVTEVLAERDDAMLAAFVDDGAVPYARLRSLLANQTARAQVHPVFFGSAITGAGVEALLAGIGELLPAASGDPDGPVSARVFKVERTTSGERVAYLRMFSGALTVRDRVPIGRGAEGRVTALSVFAAGRGAVHASSVSAGEIAKASGLEVQVGDTVGTARADAAHQFPPPTLESVVAPRHPADRGRLRVALAQLAEGDPLINVRQDDRRGEISVSLYGEVQKEVVGETLARDYGVEVDFHDTTTICIERPLRRGEALEVLYAKTKTNVTGKSSPLSSNPFPATLGMRVEPARASSGIEVRVEIDVRLLPLHIYKTTEAFVDHMAGYVGDVLQEGLCGWAVTDCVVTVVDCGYVAVGTTAADYRKLTALVLMQALEAAGTQVCEPLAAVRLEVPADAVSRVLPLLGRLGAHIEPPASDGDLATIEASVPVGRVHELQRSLPHLTGGEGVLESGFAGYQPIVGTPPTRPRTNPNPLNRDEYLMSLARRVNA
jgi:ribosomal protection tetracycline resistance protein